MTYKYCAMGDFSTKKGTTETGKIGFLRTTNAGQMKLLQLQKKDNTGR